MTSLQLASDSPPRAAAFWRIGFLVVLITSIVLGALGLIVLIAGEEWNGDFVPAFFMTMVTWLFASSAGLVCAAAMQQHRMARLMHITILGIVVSASYWTAAAWTKGFEYFSSEELHLRLAGTISLMTLGLLVAGQMGVTETPSALLRGARWLVVACADAFLLAMIGLIWTDFWYREDELVALVSVGWGIVSLVLIVVWGALVRASKRSKRQVGSESVPSRISLHLTCPRCEHEQSLQGGLTRCASCRFAMIIEVEEPRCECGYLLYQLQGDVCPECGRQHARAPQPQSSAV